MISIVHLVVGPFAVGGRRPVVPVKSSLARSATDGFCPYSATLQATPLSVRIGQAGERASSRLLLLLPQERSPGFRSGLSLSMTDNDLPFLPARRPHDLSLPHARATTAPQPNVLAPSLSSRFINSLLPAARSDLLSLPRPPLFPFSACPSRCGAMAAACSSPSGLAPSSGTSSSSSTRPSAATSSLRTAASGEKTARHGCLPLALRLNAPLRHFAQVLHVSGAVRPHSDRSRGFAC